MQLDLTINIPDVDRPGVPVAQTLREAADVIERMSPLIKGTLTDRLSGETKAGWEVLGLVPLVTAPIIDSFGPNPGPVGDGEFGFSLTGNFFPQGAELYLDGVRVTHTDVYSQWSITGGAPMRKTPGNCQAMLMYDGIGYAHFQWPFAAPQPLAPEPHG